MRRRRGGQRAGRVVPGAGCIRMDLEDAYSNALFRIRTKNKEGQRTAAFSIAPPTRRQRGGQRAGRGPSGSNAK